MEPRTHLRIDRRWCGTPLELSEGAAVVALDTLPEMAVDEHGLVHGGFVFGVADHAAMLAVNEPTVVLAAAEVQLLSPVRVGERLSAHAVLLPGDGRRRPVSCVVTAGDRPVLRGQFSCVVPVRHVLEPGAGGKGGGQ